VRARAQHFHGQGVPYVASLRWYMLPPGGVLAPFEVSRLLVPPVLRLESRPFAARMLLSQVGLCSCFPRPGVVLEFELDSVLEVGLCPVGRIFEFAPRPWYPMDLALSVCSLERPEFGVTGVSRRIRRCPMCLALV